MTTNRTEYLCSFCGKTQGQVKRLIAGPDRVFICDECVALCDQIIAEESPSQSKSSSHPKSILNPRDIFQKLEEYVIGQDQAKKILSVAVYNHYKRVAAKENSSDIELQKANILMLGPSGSGKTHLAQTLARIIDVPFAIADATSLTEAGYVGEDVENILLRLIQAADYDIGKAEQGIIYIDEIDKIARKSPNPSITRDVSGEGVQQALLKIIEGCVANVPPQGGRKHPHQDFLQIKTDNILFMCGGAFEGLEDIISQRVFKDKQSIGFKRNDIASTDTVEADGTAFQYVIADDLLDYGFIPEFIGRLPVVASLIALDQVALIRVLTEPKNAFVKQYEYLFNLDKVELVFTEEALEEAANQALKQKTGARGLRSILEQTLLDVMYELPSMVGVRECLVNGTSILGESPVTLVMETGEKSVMLSANLEQKSA